MKQLAPDSRWAQNLHLDVFQRTQDNLLCPFICNRHQHTMSYLQARFGACNSRTACLLLQVFIQELKGIVLLAQPERDKQRKHWKLKTNSHTQLDISGTTSHFSDSRPQWCCHIPPFHTYPPHNRVLVLRAPRPPTHSGCIHAPLL